MNRAPSNGLQKLGLNLCYNAWENPHIVVVLPAELVSKFVVTLKAGFVWQAIDHHNISVLGKTKQFAQIVRRNLPHLINNTMHFEVF